MQVALVTEADEVLRGAAGVGEVTEVVEVVAEELGEVGSQESKVAQRLSS